MKSTRRNVDICFVLNPNFWEKIFYENQDKYKSFALYPFISSVTLFITIHATVTSM